MKLYHGSDAGGLQTLTPRLADHGKPYVYLTDNRVAAALYAARRLSRRIIGCPTALTAMERLFITSCTPTRYMMFTAENADIFIR